MSRSVSIYQVDVFTRRRFAGNPAGVVLDADGLTDSQMLDIAREMNLSETAFVHRPTDAGAVPVRFFTPLHEVPVCGHATLGAHFVSSAERTPGPEGAVVQVSPGARWRVRWERREGATLMVMVQGPVEYGKVLDESTRREVTDALGIDPADLAPDSPIQIVSTGHAKVVVPIESPRLLDAIEPDLPRLRALSAKIDVNGFFLFAHDDAQEDTATVCRMFAPAIGIDEDPVNGSGHGPLAAYMVARGVSSASTARSGFWSRMGEHLGRPGRVWVKAAGDGGTVEVGGYVTPVFEAKITLD